MLRALAARGPREIADALGALDPAQCGAFNLLFGTASGLRAEFEERAGLFLGAG